MYHISIDFKVHHLNHSDRPFARMCSSNLDFKVTYCQFGNIRIKTFEILKIWIDEIYDIDKKYFINIGFFDRARLYPFRTWFAKKLIIILLRNKSLRNKRNQVRIYADEYFELLLRHDNVMINWCSNSNINSKNFLGIKT